MLKEDSRLASIVILRYTEKQLLQVGYVYISQESDQSENCNTMIALHLDVFHQTLGMFS